MLGIFLWTRSKEGSKIFLKPVCTLPVLIVRKEQTVILPGAKYKGETIMEDSLKNAIEQMKMVKKKALMKYIPQLTTECISGQGRS